VSLSVVFYRDPVMPMLILLFSFTQEGDQNSRSVVFLELKCIQQPTTATTVIAAAGLAKLDVSSFPDPFVVVNVDSEQTHTTSVIKKTLNPCWNEHFDVSVVLFSDLSCP
jgi:E3 ubiquitin-protein ligase NEDD4